MFRRLFGRSSLSTRPIVDRLYGQIVAAARQPTLYSHWSVPDTPLGRFEMIGLHLFLVLHRAKGEEGPLKEVCQDLTDEFFRDVEHSIRELGIGDLGVPKRMKMFSRMFYGRTLAYDEALGRRDQAALEAALARNVRPDDPAWPGAAGLASYVRAAADALAARPASDLLDGGAAFPPVAGS
jgi:cytochrome b pre-mRNA-processing protein 3